MLNINYDNPRKFLMSLGLTLILFSFLIQIGTDYFLENRLDKISIELDKEAEKADNILKSATEISVETQTPLFPKEIEELSKSNYNFQNNITDFKINSQSLLFERAYFWLHVSLVIGIVGILSFGIGIFLWIRYRQ
ncbi:MAG: hypothetical protein PHD81_04685 [Candidatus Nanoarchaeia archaeon]|nr:hypothetical protein [Candidatus Nanoarchaeia archaeon]MDD5588373.1 hypothetical protein [Candidatus Nanoarchaeia archaeon]